MKKFFTLLSAAMITLTLSSFANNSEPGKPVIKTFQENFPLASNVIWSSKKNVHTASFVNNDRAQQAYYSAEGEYLGQVWQVTLNETPENVRKEILKNATASEIKSVSLFFQPEGYPKYLAVFERNGKRTIKEIDSYGRSSIVWKRRVPAI